MDGLRYRVIIVYNSLTCDLNISRKRLSIYRERVYIHIYIYMFVCVLEYVRIWVCECECAGRGREDGKHYTRAGS